MKLIFRAARVAALLSAVCVSCLPAAAIACACGCDVFAVADPNLLPSSGHVTVFGEFDYLDQNENWSGTSSAPAANNDDKELKSNFWTLAAQATVAPNWDVMVELPFTERTFKTIPDGETTVQTFKHSSIGDVRLEGMYNGFSKDQSTGVLFGVKLPTGDFRYPGFDRDTEIGSGSTNLLIGGYHTGALSRDAAWTYAFQGIFNQPFISQDGYTPGREADVSAGVSWAGIRLYGGKLVIAPTLQAIGSFRARDSGPNADPDSTGYRRLILAPGVQVITGAWRLYGDVEIPTAQSFNGNQLVAPVFFKAVLSKSF